MPSAGNCITIAAENAAFGSTQVKYAMNGFYHGLLRKTNTQRARRMFAPRPGPSQTAGRPNRSATP